MIVLYTPEGEKVGLLHHRKNLHIQTKLNMDERTAYFEYPLNGQFAGEIQPECYIRTAMDEFVIKQTEGSNDGSWLKVTAPMNIEGIENCTFPGGFYKYEKTAQEVMEAALEGSQWSFLAEPEVDRVRTIRKEADCNGWDILQQVCKTFRCEVKIDTLRKTIRAFNRVGTDRGLLLVEGVTMERMEFTRDSYDFYTQIQPMGKDGLTLMDDPNDPVPYLSNYTYSKKVVRRIWRDERYTRVESLREDALAKLEEACRPVSNYRVKLRKLTTRQDGANADMSHYLGLGDTVRISSRSAHIRDRHRVVAIDEYEDMKNTVIEISSAATTFAEIQRTELGAAAETAAQIAKKYSEERATEAMAVAEQNAKIYSDAVSQATIEAAAQNTEEKVSEVGALVERNRGEIEILRGRIEQIMHA